ncbi:hypothetical protein NQ317_004591 [Molorchus minor]|uniref:Maturase K n=1 Tax=Molorchus minor TaxID=1323400 RepID=A0ABQ9J8M6_9CUCU|nr:hypothetical protein NQ317_004591 [Molorchus minor]
MEQGLDDRYFLKVFEELCVRLSDNLHLILSGGDGRKRQSVISVVWRYASPVIKAVFLRSESATYSSATVPLFQSPCLLRVLISAPLFSKIIDGVMTKKA